MRNILASEQSGVECECACVLRVVKNYVQHYGMCNAWIDKPVETTRSARSLRSLAIIHFNVCLVEAANCITSGSILRRSLCQVCPCLVQTV